MTDSEKSKQIRELDEQTMWDVAKVFLPGLPNTVDSLYYPYADHSNDLRRKKTYRCDTTDQNAFFKTEDIMLEMGYDVLRADGTPVRTTDYTAPVSNMWCTLEDIRLRLQNNEISHVRKPGKVSHFRNLVESSPDYLSSVGQSAGYYLDSVSDLHIDSTVVVQPIPNLIFVGGAPQYAAISPQILTQAQIQAGVVIPVVPADAGLEFWRPTGLYHEHQTLYVNENLGVAPTRSHIMGTRKNPNYDPAFRAKVDAVSTKGDAYQAAYDAVLAASAGAIAAGIGAFNASPGMPGGTAAQIAVANDASEAAIAAYVGTVAEIAQAKAAGEGAALAIPSQSIFLPVRDVFPFLDFQKVLQGTKISLEMTKVAHVPEALFGALNVADIEINKMQMWVSRVKPIMKH